MLKRKKAWEKANYKSNSRLTKYLILIVRTRDKIIKLMLCKTTIELRNLKTH